MPKVTIVISTYNRPDVLLVAIKSVVLQTFSDWKILIIGDNCDQQTEKALSSFNDTRITYINLPHRVGDQSGPNSVGIALATTKYIAFMNQDDVWLQDHLEYAIETLEKTKSDFFIGKSAFARNSKITKNMMEPIFDFVSPDYRTPDMSYDKDFNFFESVSSWVINANEAKRIGYWKQPREIHRMPIQNWVMRAWRKKTKFIFGNRFTVLNLYPNLKTKNRYSVKSLEHVFILDLLENNNPDFIRKFAEDSFERNKTPSTTEHNEDFPLLTLEFKSLKLKIPKLKIKRKYNQIVMKILLSRFAKNLFKYTGFDSYEIFFTLLRSEKGKDFKIFSVARTGKPLPKKVEIKMVIDEVKSSLNLFPGINEK